MIKKINEIIICRDTDRELYRLLDKIDITGFGTLKFDDAFIKEIKVKNSKPYQIITIEKSTLLSSNNERK